MCPMRHLLGHRHKQRFFGRGDGLRGNIGTPVPRATFCFLFQQEGASPVESTEMIWVPEPNGKPLKGVLSHSV